MTKLLILGAAGDMGSFVLRDSTGYKGYSMITIGDINEKQASELIKEISDPRVRFVRVNALSHSELVNIMKEHDVVVSCIGPFYIFGPLVARAAIEAKKPLIDICDDHGPTQKVLEMDKEAKEAGIPIMLGFGWTPGLSNFLVRYGYDKLDKDKEIRVNISWAGGAADSEGLAVIMHVLYAVTGKVPSFLDGKLVDVPAGKNHQKVEFPEPLGKIGVFDCGHPEPVTIPRYLDGITECTLKGGLTPDWNNKFAESLKQLHLVQGKRRKTFWAKLVHLTEKLFATGGIAASSARVDLYGYRDGREVHLAYATPSVPMGELTGYPASIAAQLLVEGKIKGTGVIPPEKVNPQPFFDEMKERGIGMIFDEGGEPEILGRPQPYRPGFFATYGLTILIIMTFLVFIIIFGWIISFQLG
ncbi:MAG: saccharopine dehydrogenase family protein [Candidatus Odinarchaeota archaeon]